MNLYHSESSKFRKKPCNFFSSLFYYKIILRYILLNKIKKKHTCLESATQKVFVLRNVIKSLLRCCCYLLKANCVFGKAKHVPPSLLGWFTF